MKLHLLLLLFLVPSVFALGISPARVTLSPEDTSFNFMPVTDTPVNVRVEGDLAQYIVLEKTTLQPGEEIRGSITIPQGISPGAHQQYIIIATAPSATEGFGASAEIAGSLIMQIPYPEEYLDASWDIATDEGTGAAQATITIQNLGSRATTPQVTVSIGEERFVIPSASISPSEFSKITTTISPQTPGVYDAILEIGYADKILTKTRTESFGLPVITITDLVYNDESGEIKPVDISGTVGWNRPLNATLQLYLDNNTVPILTDTLTLGNPFTQRVYVTTERPSTVKAVLSAGRASVTKEISVTQDKDSPIPLVIILLAILLVLALLALLYRRKPGTPHDTENIIKP